MTVSGTGFGANVAVGVCEGIVDATPEVTECGFAVVFQADGTGAFTDSFVVDRFITPTSMNGAVIDCADGQHQCGIGAANFSTVTPSSVVPLAFTPEPPAHPRLDILDKNRANQELFGDNVYSRDGLGVQHRSHVLVNGFWTYAVVVQNDGDVADDLIVSAPPSAGVQYFFGYFYITGPVTGAGFRFTDVQPSGSFLFAVRALGLPPVSEVDVRVTVQSGLAPNLRDATLLAFTTPG